MVTAPLRGIRCFALAVCCCILVDPQAMIGQTPRSSLLVAAPPDTFGGIITTHILIRLTPDAYRAVREGPNGNAAQPDPRNLLSAQFQAKAAAWQANKMTPAILFPPANAQRASQYGIDRMYVLNVPQGSDVRNMADDFASLAQEVELAGFDCVGGVSGGEFVPDDAQFGQQWGMHNTGQVIQGVAGLPDVDIDAPQAWAIHTGDFGTVTVALLDSGLNSHPEYGNNAPPYPNGRVLQGYNTVLNSDNPANLQDTCPHGTHIAGVIGAAGNNAQGVAGVTWGAYLMPVKILTGCGGATVDLIEGITWAADNGAQVINISVQYNIASPATIALLQSAVDYAHDAGAILVAAAGNNDFCGNGVPPSNDSVCYPARLNHVIAVSATENHDVLGTFSNYGEQIDIAAPGKDIRSTWTAGSYSYLLGTSVATPHVSGLAALIKSYWPGATNTQIESLIMETVDDLGDPGWDNRYGHGRVNAGRALAGETGACCDEFSQACENDVPAPFCVGEWYPDLTCSEINPPCQPQAVPAVSTWGLVVLFILGLVAGTLRFGNRSPAR